MREWLATLSGIQLTILLGAAWLALGVVFSLAVGRFWPDIEEED